jgi:hypothetical protein
VGIFSERKFDRSIACRNPESEVGVQTRSRIR